MLQIPELDDIRYEHLVRSAIHKIPQMTSEWTDLNHHDPGITVLETYAWLVDMLNYYINATGEAHSIQYMKLLGIERKQPAAASALVYMEPKEEMYLPEGYPVYAGKKRFISTEQTYLSSNRVNGLYYKNHQGINEVTDFAGKDGSFARVFGVGSRNEHVYISFEQPLSEEVKLYITIRERSERNTLPEEFRLSKLCFSIYDGLEWTEADVIQDGTNGLLRSGILHIKRKGMMKQKQLKEQAKGYFLRISVIDNGYDAAPEIGRCFLNPVTMVQKEVLCRRTSYFYSDQYKNYKIPYYRQEGDQILIAIRNEQKDCYDMIYEYEAQTSDRCIVDQEKWEISFLPGKEPREGSQIEVLIASKEVVDDIRIAYTDGCAGQEIYFNLEHMYELELALISPDGGSYEYWHYVEELESMSFTDRVFTYREETQCIVFGDGIYGMVPEQGSLIMISKLSLSFLEEGNVLAGEIHHMEEDSAILKASNIEGAKGGRSRETIQQMYKRMTQMLEKQERLVSPSDYVKAVKEIPGLMIRGAKVIPAQQYCRNHRIAYRPYDTYVVVCPVSMKPKEQLSDRYHDAISSYLDRYRMLNTRVHVVAPVYGRISISGRIRVGGNTSAARREVEDFIRGYIEEKEEGCQFGATLSYGDIFMHLEMLEWVKEVEELHLNLDGEMGSRNDKGDILLQSDCLPYMGKIELEYRE